MKNIVYKIIFLFFAFIELIHLNACATYNLDVQNVSLYHEGIQILDSAREKSKVRLEVGQDIVGGINKIPLAIFISALNLSSAPVVFNVSDVSLYQGEKLIKPLTNQELKNTNLNYGYIIESYHLFIPSPPMPSIDTQFIGIPIIYYGYIGGFFIHNQIVFSARERMSRQIQLDEQRMKQAIIVSSVLQKNTLQPNGPPRGGFVIYNPSHLKDGPINISIKVGDEEHLFVLRLNK